MKGTAECLFVGGPADGDVMGVPSMQCTDRLVFEQPGWLEARADGGANVMRGLRPANADWECYTRAVYEKDPSPGTGRVTYKFQDIEAVSRCAQILAVEHRRCKHEALDGEKYCRQHHKK